MGRKPLILCCTGLLAALAVAWSLLLVSSRRQTRDRDLIHSWTSGMAWWNYDLTERDNAQRRLAALRGLGDTTVRVLTSDLQVRDNFSRWRERLPIVGRFFRKGPNEDDAENVRTGAAVNLGELGPMAKPAVRELVRTLGDDADRVQMTAAFALGQIGDSSPSVLAALKKAATNSSPLVTFSSELSLWMLTHAEEHRQRVDALISSTPSWAAICFSRLGEAGRPFAVYLLRVRDQLPFSDTKIQVVQAIWNVTGEKKEASRVFEEIAHELEDPSATNSAGWNSGETALGSAAHTLDDEPEFRKAMRPLLAKALRSQNPQVAHMAKVYLENHSKLDQAPESVSTSSSSQRPTPQP